MFDPGPCVYMLKMATSRGPGRTCSTSTARSRETLELMAKEKGVAVGDIVVIMLDRPRHEDAMKEIRAVGARIRLIPHGDVSAALVGRHARARPVDLLWGIGGTPEGVLSAAAIQCTGGQIVGRLWPRARRGAHTRRSRPATTSTRCSTRTGSCPATTSSSPPPA